MRKIYYNLARTRKIDVRAFALTVTVIFLAIVMFNAITIFNLARQQRQSHAEKNENTATSK
jgi:preprotein translocase subunit YajC